jgi:hypothetical protein
MFEQALEEMLKGTEDQPYVLSELEVATKRTLEI